MAIPVTFDDARRQLRLRDGEVDPERTTEIQGFIADAAAWVEDYTGLILTARDVTERFDSFERLRLAAWPIKPDATIGVGYLQPNGTATNLYGVRLSAAARPATVLPPVGSCWPSASGVTILVRAGYEPGDTVPGNVRRAMLLLIAAYDQDREGGDLLAKTETIARRLCSGLRLKRV